MRIGIWAYNLLGSGHLGQMALLASAFPDADLVWFGQQPAQAAGRLAEAPPLAFIDGKGLDQISEAQTRTMAGRGHHLAAELHRQPVDVLITDHFPYGRQIFLPELLPLLEAAKALGIPIVSSVWDVVGRDPWLPGEVDVVVQALNTYFDLTLWHGDSRFLPCDFPALDRVGPPLAEAGYLTRRQPAPYQPRPRHLVFSSGGGHSGGLYLGMVALATCRLLAQDGWTMHLLTGKPYWDQIGALAAQEDLPGLTVEAWTPDLPGLLATASVSVSQCGINTFGEVVRSGCRGIFIPWQEPRGNEQSQRASRLCRYPGYRMFASDEPHLAESLAQAANDLLTETPPRLDLNWDGLNRSRALLLQLATRRRID